jgi:hypothetical protein
MKGCKLLDEVLASIIEVRADLHNQVDTRLLAKLDEAIAILELGKRSGILDQRTVQEALKTLGQGLALLPAIERLIRWLRE